MACSAGNARSAFPYVEPEDVANVVCHLASDESHFVTGSQFKIDAARC